MGDLATQAPLSLATLRRNAPQKRSGHSGGGYHNEAQQGGKRNVPFGERLRLTGTSPVSLAPGECHAALADARLERRRLDAFAFDAMASTPESASGASLRGGLGCTGAGHPAREDAPKPPWRADSDAAKAPRLSARRPRALRELRLPPLVHDPRGAPVRRGLYVDCETTGLDWKRDETIEVGMLPFTDGALSPDRERGLTAPRRGFLFPTAALSKVFRGKYLDALTAAHRTGELHMPGEQDLDDSRAFESLKTSLQSNHWVVYSKAPFAGAAHVLAYLGRYTHERHRHPNAPWALPTDTPAKPGPDCRADENEPALSLSADACAREHPAHRRLQVFPRA